MTTLFRFSVFSRNSGSPQKRQHPHRRSQPVLSGDFFDWCCLPASIANLPNEVWHYSWRPVIWTVKVSVGFKWILVLWTQRTGIQQSDWYPEHGQKETPLQLKGGVFDWLRIWNSCRSPWITQRMDGLDLSLTSFHLHIYYKNLKWHRHLVPTLVKTHCVSNHCSHNEV